MFADPYSRFALDTFESLDVEGADSATVDKLRGELELEIASRMTALPGWEGLEEVVSGLHQNGHRFERRETDEGWVSFFQETNEGTRDFWIHASREEDLILVDVLYFEKLEVTAPRRRERMSQEERADAELVDTFYDQGLELAKREDELESLPDGERLHLTLYLLESGVNNGGFRTYISNTEGAYLSDCVEFLSSVDAHNLEAIVRDVLALFPSGFADGMTDEIWEAIEEDESALDDLDARFYSTTDNLARLVMQYLADSASG